LERDRELAVLEAAARDAAVGHPALVVVEGPAGIGKSRLLGEARAGAAGAGFRVLSARGSGLERELPFGVVGQLFEPVLVEPDQRVASTFSVTTLLAEIKNRAGASRRWSPPSGPTRRWTAPLSSASTSPTAWKAPW
jgi:AAA ATPase domain